MTKKYISRAAAAQMLGVTNQTISNYAEKGLIHATKRKNLLLVKREDVERLLKELDDIVGIETRIANYKAELRKTKSDLQKEQLMCNGLTIFAARSLTELFKKYVPSSDEESLTVMTHVLNFGYKKTADYFNISESEVLRYCRYVIYEIRKHKPISILEGENERLKETNEQLTLENRLLRSQLKEQGTEAEKLLSETSAQQQLYETNIFDCYLDRFSVRAINCFKIADIETVGDLMKHTRRDLYKIRCMGRKTIMEVAEFLKSLGLELAE